MRLYHNKSMKYNIFKRYDKNVDPVNGETFTDHMVQVLDPKYTNLQMRLCDE